MKLFILKISVFTIILFFFSPSLFAQEEWDMRLVKESVDCDNEQACYRLQVQSASGNNWTLGDQNYRFFFDGDYMTISSVTSLLPASYYGAANIDQNIKISGQGQEAASPLDDIDDNLGFLDFSMVQTDKSSPNSAFLVNTSGFTSVAEICVDVVSSVFTDNNCLSFYHSRPSTAGGITSQYTVLSENNASGSTTAANANNYDDLTPTDGTEACISSDCTVVISENQWDIQLTKASTDCDNNQVCYQLEVQNTSGTAWALGDQNYRLFFDGDLMTVNSVASLLPATYYGAVNIDQNIKVSGQGQESASPLDDIDNNLGFLDFNIVQTDKSNPNAAQQITAGAFTPIATICTDVDPLVFTDQSGGSCLAFYHSRPSTAGTFTSQYTTLSENNAPSSTTMTEGVNFDDVTSTDGTEACLNTECTVVIPENQWDIQLTKASTDCDNNQVCYQLEVQNTSGTAWTLGDQNYRLFFDGDLMTVNSVTSLLPAAYYGAANIDQNIKVSGQGQETASPLDDIDNNLGFLDFNIVQTDKSNPSAAQQIAAGAFTPVATICTDVEAQVFTDQSGGSCLAFYHSRPSTAGTFTTQYTTLSENNAPSSTTMTEGVNFDDVTSTDGTEACLNTECTVVIPENQWDIQLTKASTDCDNNQVCYQLEVQNTSGNAWTLGDQNYRLFFDGDLMTVNSVTSLLPATYYGAANIDQNIKVSGQGQEAASPLDDIDNNLGFLDFNIVQTDKSNPGAAQQIAAGAFTSVATICTDVDPVVFTDQSGGSCLAFYHSRPSTAGSFTSQYTTLSENNAPSSTTMTEGVNFDDVTSTDGTEACLNAECTVVIPENQWDIQLTKASTDCDNNQVCYQLEVQNTSGTAWALGDQNYRLFFDGDLMTVNSVASLLPATYYGAANIDQNIKVSGQGQESASPLDDIDNNLGFLDFNIVQTDKSNPGAAQQIVAGAFIPVATICTDVDPLVFTDQSGGSCLAFYHSRPSTAGSFTSQYTTLSENDAPSSTTMTEGVNFDDMTSADGTEACLNVECTSDVEYDYQDYMFACTSPACHVLNPDIYLGSIVSAENMTTGSVDADTDDDDGVVFPNNIRPGITVRFPVTIYNNTNNTARLRAWADWNNNNIFEPSEQIIAEDYPFAQDSGTFLKLVPVQVPTTVVTGEDIPLRFRLSTDDITSPCGENGCATNGEVEDYLIQVECAPTICLPVQLTIRRGNL